MEIECVNRENYFMQKYLKKSDFNYELPDELIAKYPVAQRTASRLLCLENQSDEIIHRHFHELPELLNAGDLLVFNNTYVVPARLFGEKASGGKIEVLMERILDNHKILAHVRASKSPKPGMHLLFADNISAEVVGRHEDLFEIIFHGEQHVLEILEAIGHIPLPPYINREDELQDKQRYQTVYGEIKGAVAAPTAGLHFDENLLQELRTKEIQTAFITLHVGAGTFLPMRVDNIADHVMHKEYAEISVAVCEQIKQTQKNGGRIIAVGTTSTRVLETAAMSGEIKPFKGDTQLFITPGFQFNCVDAMITNFHLPESTLMMLVCAFAGYEKIMAAYREAVSQQYRFFSYGDAMFLQRNQN